MEITKASRKEIISEVAKRSAVSYAVANHVFNKLSEVMEEKLKEGKEVQIPYIGTFYFYRTKPMVSNLTQQLVPVHYKVKFRLNKNIDRYVRVMSREL